jgi:AcrR family transcriptional regulator
MREMMRTRENGVDSRPRGAVEKAKRTPRKKPAQTRSKETVRAIVTAAARILEREGYDKTNVNLVAELAGVSIGSLYQYFPSKEALVAEVARQLSNEMIAAFQDGLLDLAFLPMQDAVRGVVTRAVRAFRMSPRLREVIMLEMPAQLFDTTEFDTMLAEALRFYFQYNVAQLRLKNIDLAIVILKASVEAAANASATDEFSEDEVVRELTHLVYQYVAK